MKTRFVFLSCLCATALTACLGGGGGGGGIAANTNPSGLSAPTGVSAIGGDGQATVSWSPVPGAVSYNAYIGTDNHVSTGNYTRKISSASSPATISGLQNGSAYWVTVTATDATSESGVSSRVRFIPSIGPVGPVTDLSAAPRNNSVTLRWTAVANATGYWIQWATDANFVAGMREISTSGTSWTFSSLANGTTYFFRIRAGNGSSQSSYSAAVSATPNYMSGWNDMTLLNYWTNIADPFTGPAASRTDNLNSSRDALCVWAQAESVFVATYTKTTDWRGGYAIATLHDFFTTTAIIPVMPSSSLSDNGEGAVAWIDRTYADLVTRQSSLRDDIFVRHYQGGVWGAPILLSGTESGGFATTPEIKLDKDGNGVAAWHGNDGNFYVRTYDRTANAWSATTMLGTGINPAVDAVRIGVDGFGGFVLAWSEKTATSTGVNGVFLRKYSKAGGWGATERVNLDDPALDAFNGIQSLSVNANGDVFVLWEHSPAASDHRLMLRRYAAAAATWNDPVTVDISNGSLSRGKVKSNSATNAVISWFKTVGNAGATVDSHNFAVYREATGGIGPVEQMLLTDYAIRTVDIVTDAANSFRVLYALSSAPAIVYERDYDIITQTWGMPALVDSKSPGYGVMVTANPDFIATANAAGEMMLTTKDYYFYDSFPGSNGSNDWDGIKATFYLP